MRRWILPTLYAHLIASYVCGLTTWVVVDLWYHRHYYSPAGKWLANMLFAPLWVPLFLVVAPLRALAAGSSPSHVTAIYWLAYAGAFVVTILVVHQRRRRRKHAAHPMSPTGQI